MHNSVTGSVWTTSLLFSLIQELTVLWSPEASSIDGKSSHFGHVGTRASNDNDPFTAAAASSRVAAYNKFVARIEELGLPAAVDAMPVLDVSSFPPCSSCISSRATMLDFIVLAVCPTHANGLVSAPHALMSWLMQGREVTKLLGATPGPWTGTVLARVVEWQLEHPEGTKQQCEAWLREEQAAGRINTMNATIKRGQGAGADAKTKKAKR